ncbi:GNAT superfamily N-acetyltransferase [Bradyrhizobium sp. LM6.11]
MTALRKTQVDLSSKAAPFAIRSERAADVAMREALLDASFGENRHGRTCQRLRDGRAPAAGLALSAVRGGTLVGTVRLWHVSAGGRPALVLGPLAVDPACRELGIGAALMQQALAAARARGACRCDPARRCPLLRPLRLLTRENWRAVAARPVRARPPAGDRIHDGRAGRRYRDDRPDRRGLAQTPGGSRSPGARGLRDCRLGDDPSRGRAHARADACPFGVARARETPFNPRKRPFQSRLNRCPVA